MSQQKKKKNIPLIFVGIVLLVAITSLRSQIGSGITVSIIQVCALVIILYGFGMSWARRNMRKSKSITAHTPDKHTDLGALDSKDKHETMPQLTVIGLGGAGIAIINRLASYNKLPIKKYIAIDTDPTAVNTSKATVKILLDVKKDASEIEIMMAAHAVEDEITDATSGTDIVFFIVSPGGDVGFNTWSIVTDTLKKCKVLNVLFAIKPFSFEDAQKQAKTLASIDTMKSKADVFVEASNDRMLQSTPKSVPLHESFKLMDYALVDGIERVYNFVAQNGIDDTDKIQGIMDYAVHNFVDNNK